MTTYNGWTNYATWRVNLEIFDGYDARDFMLPRDWHAREGARRAPSWDKALLRRARRDLPKWHEGWKKGYRT